MGPLSLSKISSEFVAYIKVDVDMDSKLVVIRVSILSCRKLLKNKLAHFIATYN